MALREYMGLKKIQGPFVLVESVSGVGYGELVSIIVPSGKERLGRVVLLDERATLVQVFSGTDELVPESTRSRFLGKGLSLTLAPSILGRTFSGLGEPRDTVVPSMEACPGM
jgi:V/A-type H+-transporting ATPase subunit B